MSRTANGALLYYLDSLCAAPDVREQTDGQLLDRFVTVRDESAFAVLLRRHGPLVLRVCRSVLRHEQDAEDAFQATFLVLALRAASVRKGRSLGSWLYGVAQRTALAADRRGRRRRKYEQRAVASSELAPPMDDACVEELRRALDEETSRLPEKYRLPFLLCCLEGKSRQAAARDLGWPEGTLSSRLAEARRLLEQQLSRRGFVLSAILAAGLVSTTVPATLAQATARAALALTATTAGMATVPAAVLALTKGVSKAMVLSKIKSVVALTMVLGVLGVGAGLSAQAGRGPAGDGSARVNRPDPQPREEDVRAEAERLEGLLRAKRWKELQEQTERLLAGNRLLATRVLGIVLKNTKLEGRPQLLTPIQTKRFKDAVPLLIDLLDDPDRGVRSWSVIVLGSLKDPAAIPPLEKRLKAERTRGMQWRIRLALAHLGKPYLAYFLNGLTDRDHDRRRLCLVAIGEIKDVRAVPHVMRLLDDRDSWGPVNAAACLTQLTGVPNMTVTGTIKHPDGSVQTNGVLRPFPDVKKDCEAWLARHRNEVARAIEKSAEPWDATPEPYLPGLKVSFSMTPKQVLDVHKKAGIKCQHDPERRWKNGETAFFSPETITPERSCLPALNTGLVGISYVFEDGKLSEVQLTRVGHGEEVIAPLKKLLRLRDAGPGGWTGLDGTIVVSPSVGDGEKEMVVIGLNFRR